MSVFGQGFRVLVTGGRDYNDYDDVKATLAWVQRGYGIRAIIRGDADGADFLCGQWAELNGVPTEVYRAEWRTHGKRAGPIRNQRMIDEGKPDAYVAFPGGRGTADCVARCERAKLPRLQPASLPSPGKPE